MLPSTSSSACAIKPPPTLNHAQLYRVQNVYIYGIFKFKQSRAELTIASNSAERQIDP